MALAQPRQSDGLSQSDQILFGQVALRIDGFYPRSKPIVTGKRLLASFSATPTDP